MLVKTLVHLSLIKELVYILNVFLAISIQRQTTDERLSTQYKSMSLKTFSVLILMVSVLLTLMVLVVVVVMVVVVVVVVVLFGGGGIYIFVFSCQLIGFTTLWRLSPVLSPLLPLCMCNWCWPRKQLKTLGSLSILSNAAPKLCNRTLCVCVHVGVWVYVGVCGCVCVCVCVCGFITTFVCTAMPISVTVSLWISFFPLFFFFFSVQDLYIFF